VDVKLICGSVFNADSSSIVMINYCSNEYQIILWISNVLMNIIFNKWSPLYVSKESHKQVGYLIFLFSAALLGPVTQTEIKPSHALRITLSKDYCRFNLCLGNWPFKFSHLHNKKVTKAHYATSSLQTFKYLFKWTGRALAWHKGKSLFTIGYHSTAMNFHISWSNFLEIAQ
jgi:hypothetical protein